MTFLIIGFGTSLKFLPEILDKRVDSFNIETENLWLALWQNTGCAVGVMGSNMLLPSGLAECAVELLPEVFYGNMLQDHLLRDDVVDPCENLFRFRVLYGNEELTDISPYRVAQVIVSQISERERLHTILNIFQPSQDCQPGADPRRIVEALSKYRYLPPPRLSSNSRVEGYRHFLRHTLRKIRGYFYW